MNGGVASSILVGLLAIASCARLSSSSVDPGNRPDGMAPPTQPGDAAGEAGGQCAERAYKAEPGPLDLLLVVDASLSMFLTGPDPKSTNWGAMANALKAFVHDSRSSGLGVGLTFFPVAGKPCETAADCPTTGDVSPICRNIKACAPVIPDNPVACGDHSQCRVGECVPMGRCSLTASSCWNVGSSCLAGEGTCTMVTPTCLTVPAAHGCDSAVYTKAVVDIGRLPASEPALLRGIADRDMNIGGGTPMEPAVVGSLTYLGAHMKANSGRKAAMIIATDGVPDGCDPGSNSATGVARALAAARAAAQPISTYLVGVSSFRDAASAKWLLDPFAMAGGTGEAIIVTAGVDITQKLQDAFNRIRGVVVACEFQVPASDNGTPIDFHKVNVRYTSGDPAARREDLPYVGKADRCDPTRGGWYYDVDPDKGTPTLLKICDQMCGKVQADVKGRVDLVFGCASVVIQ